MTQRLTSKGPARLSRAGVVLGLAGMGLTLSGPTTPALGRGPDDSDRLHAQFIGGATTAVAVGQGRAGDIGFVAVGVQVLVHDLDDPAGPRRIGLIGPLPEVPEDLALADGVLYIAGPRPEIAGDGGPGGAWLRLYDVREPAEPLFLGEVALPGRRAGALVVAPAPARAYVLTESGVVAVDVADPGQPRILSQVDTPDPDQLGRAWWPGGLALLGGHLLVARPEGLFALSLLPEMAASTPAPIWPGPAYDVAVAGDKALLLDDAGLQVLDLNRPYHQAYRIATLDVGPRPRAIAVADSQAAILVADGFALARVDLTALQAPRLAATLPLPPLASEHLSVALTGTRAVLALGRVGLRLVDLAASPQGPAAAGLAPIELVLPPLEQVAVAGTELVAAAGPAGLFFLSAGADGVARPVGAFQPEVLGAEGQPRRVSFYAVSWMGRRVYAHSAVDGLWVLDAADPARPLAVGRPLTVPGLRSSHAMARIGSRLYVPGGDGALYVVDSEAEGGPRVVTRLPHLGINTVLARGGYLYGTAVGRYGIGYLHVLDAANPAIPRYLRTLDFDVAFSRLSAAGARLYLTGGFGDMAVLDLSDPAAPREGDRLKRIFAGQLAAVGDRLLAAQPSRLELLVPAGAGARSRLDRTPGPRLPWGRQDWQGTSDVLAEGDALWVLRHQAGLMRLDRADFLPARRPVLLPWVAAPEAKGSAGGPAAPSATTPPVTPISATGACHPPASLTLVLGGRGALDAAATAALRRAVDRIAGSPAPAPRLSLVVVDRQARSGGLASWPDGGLGALASVPPGLGAALRLDLGLAAAVRSTGAGRSGAERVILVLGARPDEESWRLALARAGLLRLKGAQVHALVWHPDAGPDPRLGLLTGDADRVWVESDATALGERLLGLAQGCD